MIQVQNYNFAYEKTAVLKNFNLKADTGKITAIIGPNGAGKSTLLKSTTGLLQGEGSIQIDGQEITTLSQQERAKNISYLPQDLSCDAALTVFEIVLLGMVGRLGTRIDDQDIERTHAVLETFGIAHFAQRYIGALSGGQRQMVFVAQALVKTPKVLVFDEPTSSLDLCRQYELMEQLKTLTHDHQLTTLLTLHHLDLVAKYADQVVVVFNQSVYACGTVAEVLQEDMFRNVFQLKTEVFTDSRNTVRVLPIEPC